ALARSTPLRSNAARTAPYTPSLHDALPIFASDAALVKRRAAADAVVDRGAAGLQRAGLGRPAVVGERSQHRVNRRAAGADLVVRSEEHTSELQSRENLVCRLLLEKKNHNSL